MIDGQRMYSNLMCLSFDFVAFPLVATSHVDSKTKPRFINTAFSLSLFEVWHWNIIIWYCSVTHLSFKNLFYLNSSFWQSNFFCQSFPGKHIWVMGSLELWNIKYIVSSLLNNIIFSYKSYNFLVAIRYTII